MKELQLGIYADGTGSRLAHEPAVETAFQADAERPRDTCVNTAAEDLAKIADPNRGAPYTQFYPAASGFYWTPPAATAPSNGMVVAHAASGAEPARDCSATVPAGFALADPAERPGAPCTAQEQGRIRSPMLEELAEAIGEESLLRLLETRGGMRVYIPHQPKASDSLAASIGLSAAIGLSQIYGGDRIEVPNPTPRKVRILELRSHGLSIDAIAHQLGCTRRRVFQVLADAHAGRRSNAERTHGS
jgi:hypothetical protein